MFEKNILTDKNETKLNLQIDRQMKKKTDALDRQARLVGK